MGHSMSRRLLRAVLFSGLVIVAAASSASCGGDDTHGNGGCSGPVEECQALCDEYCQRLTACGQAPADCSATCGKEYACPGETPDQDRAICRGERSRITATCEGVCQSTQFWSECNASDAGDDAPADGGGG
jgi:hypothetical protein